MPEVCGAHLKRLRQTVNVVDIISDC